MRMADSIGFAEIRKIYFIRQENKFQKIEASRLVFGRSRLAYCINIRFFGLTYEVVLFINYMMFIAICCFIGAWIRLSVFCIVLIFLLSKCRKRSFRVGLAAFAAKK